MAELNPESSVPLYRQLFAHFVREIESGRLRDGERLPATRELAGQLRLNRTTVSAAYDLLDTEGWISGEVGRGSFVRRKNESTAFDWLRLMRPAPSPRQNSVTTAGISFAQSRPSEDLFPIEAFHRSADAVLRSKDLASILQLGAPAGYEPLRRYLLEQARSEGNASADDDVLVTNGCQQALDLIRQVLIQTGDAVALEDPVYPGLRNLFAHSGAVLTGVKVDREGIEAAAVSRVKPKLAVVTSSFQNPTGASLSLERKEALLRVPETVFVENDIYSALRYRGEAQPTLKKLDRSGRVVLLRSFSKIAFPGLRVGWIVGPRVLIQRLTEAKQLTDLHTDQFSQAVLLHFAQSGSLAEHQRNMLTQGRERLDATLDALRRYFPAPATWTQPSGGMNLWLRLPEQLDAALLLARAQGEGVAFLPGRTFSVTATHHDALRLSFAGLTEERITQGIKILGTLTNEMLEAERSRDREPVLAMV